MQTQIEPKNFMTNKSSFKFDAQEDNLHYEGVVDVDPRELLKRKNEVHLVDVRQPDEFQGELGHIPGAKLIVLDTLPEHMDEIPTDKPVVFVCRSGGRSARAAAFAQSQGRNTVFNMKGGMLLWNELHFPTEI